MRFDFAHFIEQVEFYALFYAGLIGMVSRRGVKCRDDY